MTPEFAQPDDTNDLQPYVIPESARPRKEDGYYIMHPQRSHLKDVLSSKPTDIDDFSWIAAKMVLFRLDPSDTEDVRNLFENADADVRVVSFVRGNVQAVTSMLGYVQNSGVSPVFHSFVDNKGEVRHIDVSLRAAEGSLPNGA